VLEREGIVIRRARQGSFVALSRRSASTGYIAFAHRQAVDWDGYWGRLLEGVRDAARIDHKPVLLMQPPCIEQDWSNISGLVIAGRQNVIAPVPTVSLLGEVPGYTAVLADEGAAIAKVMKHLTDLGHVRIAYLPVTGTPADERMKAYLAGLMEVGIQPNPHWCRPIHESPSPDHVFYNFGLKAMTAWLADNWRELGCTALLAHNDDTALGAIDALNAAGISVPRDVSVVGFDGILSESSRPTGLTTIAMPLFEMGRAAVLQLRAASGDSSVVTVKLEAHLRLGTTTGPAATRG
jgi:DNA-binding LacI/PurR family transcriptional regulator